MPPPEPVLIAALSGRSLAASARRAGWAPIVVDAFGDEDTAAAAAAMAVVPVCAGGAVDGAAFLAAATRLAPPPIPLVWGAVLDDRPELLAALSAGRPLLGARSATVEALLDPIAFAHRLARLGIPHPETRATPPQPPSGWLTKRAGGTGGGHVLPAGGPVIAGAYWQRRAQGVPISALVLGDGARAIVLGFSLQWPDPRPGRPPFRFCGVAVPAVPPPGLAEAAARLAADIGLRGLGSVDALADGERFVVLEINPRPGGSLDAFELAHDVALFERHVAACSGELRSLPRPLLAAATCVVYAERRIEISAMDWPGWASDRPVAGTVIEAGEPFCTVRAIAGDAAGARRLAEDRANRVRRVGSRSSTDARSRSDAALASAPGTAGW